MDEIIVGVDESATAKAAAHQAAVLAQQLGKPLHLVLALKRRQASSFSAGGETVVVDGPFLRLPSHSLKLGAKDEVLWQKILADLRRERFKPPRVRDFADAYDTPEADVRRLMRRVAKIGRVVEIAQDQYFLRPVVAEMIGIAHGFGREFTAAEFRDKLDNGRKVAILILEFFDRHGVTVRKGDLRRTVPQKLEQFGPLVAPSTDAPTAAPAAA